MTLLAVKLIFAMLRLCIGRLARQLQHEHSLAACLSTYCNDRPHESRSFRVLTTIGGGLLATYFFWHNSERFVKI